MGNQLSVEREVEEHFKASAPGKKHICVIGAGSSGLHVMKELTLLGHTVDCYEGLPTIGGVYVKSYQNTILTTSSLLTAWSSFSDGKEAQPKFWSAEEYLAYINNFAEKFDLLKNINFSHEVLLVKKCEQSGKWMVTVKGGKGCEDIERCENTPENPLGTNHSHNDIHIIHMHIILLTISRRHFSIKPKNF
jgi:cation diffusion facilitator CzcD-associated flavoprotein CzcO